MGHEPALDAWFHREGTALPRAKRRAAKTDALADRKGPLDALRWTAKVPGSRDLDRWDDLQKARPHRRQPHHRRRDLGGQPHLCRFRYRVGEYFIEPVLHKTSTGGCCTVTNRWSRRVAAPF